MKSKAHQCILRHIQGKGHLQIANWLLACLMVLALAACTFGSHGQGGQAPLPSPTALAPTPTSTFTPTPTSTSTPIPTPTPPAPGWSAQEEEILAQLGHPAKAILVSIDQQVLHAYQDGVLIQWSYVTTGRPELPSPKGYWKVLQRLHPTTFYSPWPPGSPYWYPPTFINYALEYHDGGYFLHDATWRHYYGPGTNVWHQNPDGTWEDGTHGCINMPLDFMAWLYDWTPLNTPVVVF